MDRLCFYSHDIIYKSGFSRGIYTGEVSSSEEPIELD